MNLTQPSRFAIACAASIATVGTLGLPIVTALTHDLNPATWPDVAMQPGTWLQTTAGLNFSAVINTYAELAEGKAAAFDGGGRAQFWGLLATCAVAPLFQILGMTAPVNDHRDHSGQLGNARWASRSEKAGMSSGLEIGIDPESGKPVRIALESNGVSIAPPRSGKSSGLVTPNLLCVEGGWTGAVVIIDPTGEVFAATGKRRQQLGRRAARFDLRRRAKGSHHWNPLYGIAIDDVERLIAMARVMVVDGGPQNAYFSDRAVEFLAGVMAAELLDASRKQREPAMQNVARLLSAHETLLAIAQNADSQILQSLTGDLLMDERSRDQIISTAKTAVGWLSDERFAKLTSTSSFSLRHVVRGQLDLFVIVPPTSIRFLAPLLSLLLTDLMTRAMTDRCPDDERVLVMVDETAALGRFSELELAVGLLPGHGLSFWSFWQSMSQMEKIYGSGARVFLDTAEFLTVSDFSVFGKDTEEFSKALGNFTAYVEGTSDQQSASGKSSSKNRIKQAVPLMPPEALRTMPADELIVLLNSKRYSRHPLRLKKLRYFKDARFVGLYRDVKPTSAL